MRRRGGGRGGGKGSGGLSLVGVTQGGTVGTGGVVRELSLGLFASNRRFGRRDVRRRGRGGGGGEGGGGSGLVRVTQRGAVSHRSIVREFLLRLFASNG
jgi:hypothetical protein